MIHGKPPGFEYLLRSRSIRRNRIQNPAQEFDFLLRNPLFHEALPVLSFVVCAVVIGQSAAVVVVQGAKAEVVGYGSFD
jgi:hypothetical protein